MKGTNITVKELIEFLSSCNKDAIITVGDNLNNGVSLSISGGDGCTKENCDYVCFDTAIEKQKPETTNIRLLVTADWNDADYVEQSKTINLTLDKTGLVVLTTIILSHLDRILAKRLFMRNILNSQKI